MTQPVPDLSAAESVVEASGGDRVVRHLSARTKARKRALDILFEAELRGDDPLATLATRTDEGDPPIRELTTTLVHGVVEHRDALDARIVAALPERWSLERMPRVDRALARIAVFEIDHTGLDPDVAISEAVLLASGLSTEESPAFLSGLLGAVVRGPRG